jgi:hypothetical protein
VPDIIAVLNWMRLAQSSRFSVLCNNSLKAEL